MTRENNTLRGKLNHIKGQVTEFQFANALRSRKRFRLADFFTDATDDTLLNMVDVQTRVTLRRPDGGQQELDIVAQSSDNRVILIEVKNQQERPGEVEVATFLEKIALYRASHPDQTILPAFLSLAGFTQKALDLCRQQGIAWTTELQYF